MRNGITALLVTGAALFGAAGVAQAQDGEGESPVVLAACQEVRTNVGQPVTPDAVNAAAQNLVNDYGLTQDAGINYIDSAVESIYTHSTFMCED